MYDDYLEERVDKLEQMIMRLVYIQQKTEMEIQSLKNEMKEFKDEMTEFKNKIDKYVEWSKENIEWSKNQIRYMNQQWGNLSNKLGTIVEDIIFPATKPILRKFFNCETEWIGMNISKKLGGKEGEFDVIAICNDKLFLIEVKATPKVEYINEFLDKRVPLFKELFPEYKDKKLILIFASLRIPESIVKYLTKKNIYNGI